MVATIEISWGMLLIERIAAPFYVLIMYAKVLKSGHDRGRLFAYPPSLVYPSSAYSCCSGLCPPNLSDPRRRTARAANTSLHPYMAHPLSAVHAFNIHFEEKGCSACVPGIPKYRHQVMKLLRKQKNHSAQHNHNTRMFHLMTALTACHV